MLIKRGSISPLSKFPLIVGFALLSLVFAGFAPGAKGQASPPVLLHKEVLLTPVEAAGTGLAPELQVRVTVDERGLVSEVEILGIAPASEFDEVFEEATRENLATWRYAPAMEKGQAVETQLEWTLQFKSKETREVVAMANVPPLLMQRVQESRRAAIFNLPPELRTERLNRFVKLGERHMNKTHRRKIETPRFVVVCDSESPTAGPAVADALEATFNTLDSLFAVDIPPLPEPYKMVVFLYGKEASFDAVRQELQQPSLAQGFYAAPGFLSFHLQVPSVEVLLQVLIHEATHAYTDRHLFRRGNPMPRWLGEGFAEYMGNSRIDKKGVLIPGETLKSQYALSHYRGARRQTTVAGSILEELRGAVRKGEGLSLEELLDSERAAFLEKAHLYYPTSWLFVHFLAHGEAEWEKENFPRFMLYMAEGYSAESALEAVYGVTVADLEAPFGKYVKKF